jgi:pimeloyl-ACP methyl ester carboxylesterase
MAAKRTGKKKTAARKANRAATKARTSRTKTSTEQGFKSGYAPVNGLNMYYEIHGAGEPLILLHGGVGGIEMFGPNLSALAKNRQVIAVDFQGHGRTADIDRPLRNEFMADDIAALMNHLGMDKADFMGHSLGAGIALQLAIRHPELVRKLVLVSTVFRQDGWYPEIQAAFAQMGPQAAEGLKQSPLAALYPNHEWGVLFGKIHDLEASAYDYSKDVAALRMPTLLIFADADSIQPAHIMEFYSLLGGGKRDAGLDGSGRSTNQLAILPGVTHYAIDSTPGLASTVIPFLEASMPEAK